MLETLESRQMFSVSALDTTALAADTSTATTDAAATTDIVITKTVDKSSPTLFKACCTGEHLKEAVVTVR